MQRGYTPPPVWGSPPNSGLSSGAIIGIVVAIVIVVVMGTVISALWAMSGAGAFAVFPVVMTIVFATVLAIAAAATASGAGRRALPPPPPIQQPMVPAGMTGPIAMNCPNCGAPPEAVDRFGVATCSHCATRFLVR